MYVHVCMDVSFGLTRIAGTLNAQTARIITRSREEGSGVG